MCMFFLYDFVSTDYVYCFSYMCSILMNHVYFFPYLIFYPLIKCIFYHI